MNDTPAIETASFDVFVENKGKLEEKVAEMNRRIERLRKKGYEAFSPLTLTWGATHLEWVKRTIISEGVGPVESEPFQAVKQYVTLSGAPTVVVSGWRFVAVVQHEEGGLVAKVPGSENVDVSAYRGCAPKCDHCGYLRTRKDTYVLRNETTGEFKQVGSSCLADFLGRDPFVAATMAEHLAILWDLVSEWDDEFLREGARTAFSAEQFLAVTAATIEKHGWLSRGAAREKGMEGSATADKVMVAITSKPNDKEYLVPTAEQVAYARKVLAWAQERFEGAR